MMVGTISGVHECTLSRTNSGGTVALCTCGWIGAVHPSPRHETPDGKRTARDYDRSARDASGEWRRHFTVDHVPLVPDDLSRAVPGLTRRGRFGSS